MAERPQETLSGNCLEGTKRAAERASHRFGVNSEVNLARSRSHRIRCEPEGISSRSARRQWEHR
jgi:hypothetical protein